MKKKQTKIEADIKQAHKDYKKGDYRVFNPKTGELDQPQEAWEIEFDKIREQCGWIYGADGLKIPEHYILALKSFICTLLEAQKQEIVEEIEKLRARPYFQERNKILTPTRTSQIINMALDEIIKRLTP
jgi:hypothetical protein